MTAPDYKLQVTEDFYMKVALAKEMHEIDSMAIEDYGLPELSLMESAGHRVFEAVTDDGLSRVIRVMRILRPKLVTHTPDFAITQSSPAAQAQFSLVTFFCCQKKVTSKNSNSTNQPNRSDTTKFIPTHKPPSQIPASGSSLQKFL